MDGAAIVQWVAIALTFVAVIVILRYARQPRCEVCSRRHAGPDLATGGLDVGLIHAEVPEAGDSAAISWRAE